LIFRPVENGDRLLASSLQPHVDLVPSDSVLASGEERIGGNLYSRRTGRDDVPKQYDPDVIPRAATGLKMVVTGRKADIEAAVVAVELDSRFDALYPSGSVAVQEL
jgi:hypothetical protein